MITRRKFLSGVGATAAMAVQGRNAFGKGPQADDFAYFQLSGGRRLSYTVYGAQNGWPVLYFHGIPTSRIEAKFFADAACKMNCQLIAIDRPGYGSSDFQCGRQIIDWIDDIQEFVDSPASGIDLTRFSIACFSSGAAYALACGTAIPPDRLTSIGIVDGIAPLNRITRCGGVAQIMFRLANRQPRLVKSILEYYKKQIQRRPQMVLRQISRFFSRCDRSMFFEPRDAGIMVESFKQCVLCGPEGVAYDMAILSQPWGFCLNDVETPVGLWYGACDKTTPVAAMGRCLSSELPNCSYSVFDQEGHLSMLNAAGDALFEHIEEHAVRQF